MVKLNYSIQSLKNKQIKISICIYHELQPRQCNYICFSLRSKNVFYYLYADASLHIRPVPSLPHSRFPSLKHSQCPVTCNGQNHQKHGAALPWPLNLVFFPYLSCPTCLSLAIKCFSIIIK